MSAITQADQPTEHEFADELMDEALDRSEGDAAASYCCLPGRVTVD